jgi:hypothetical protein
MSVSRARGIGEQTTRGIGQQTTAKETTRQCLACVFPIPILRKLKMDDSGKLIAVLPDEITVKVVGLGGVGCALLPHLAVFLRSTGKSVRLVLIDGDEFEALSNSKRMIFHEVGNKAEVKAKEIRQTLGDACNINVIAIPEYITNENLERLIKPNDIVFLCVDNHPTRKLVSDQLAKLTNGVIVSGGNEGVDPPRERGTYGNAQIYIRRDGKDLTVPLGKYHPEIANPKGKLPSDMDCIEMAFSMPQILFTNLAVASAMLNTFYALLCGKLTYQEVKFDVLEGRSMPQLQVKQELSLV